MSLGGIIIIVVRLAMCVGRGKNLADGMVWPALSLGHGTGKGSGYAATSAEEQDLDATLDSQFQYDTKRTNECMFLPPVDF